MRLPPVPTVVSHAVLFRSLLPLRPSLPLKFRFRGLPNAELHAQAFSPHEANVVHDEAQCLPESERKDRILAAYVANSLVDSLHRRIFASADEVGSFDESEFHLVSTAVWNALGRVGPLLRHADAEAWHAALCAGAKDPSNAQALYLLSQSYDVAGMSGRILDRPERFWGVPACQLLDGHILVYRAARAVYEERQPRH